VPGKKILVVDDDIQLCQLVSDILEEHGFQTLVAYNTDQAFKKLYENNPGPDRAWTCGCRASAGWSFADKSARTNGGGTCRS
jgi:hypothetical protein